VYRRDGGLTQGDRALIAQDRGELEQVATEGRPPPPVVSRDRTTALNVAPFKPTGEGDIVTRDVDRVREAVDGAPPGLQVEVTGLIVAEVSSRGLGCSCRPWSSTSARRCGGPPRWRPRLNAP
jgi:hypothetical protein